MSAPRRDDLSATLRALRKDAGLSGPQVARASALSQAKVSRIETGRHMPTEAEIHTLCDLYQAPAPTRRNLVQVARDIRESTTSARVVLQRGAWRMQERIGRIEAESARIRGFHPSVVLGLVQTADYTRTLLSGQLDGQDLDQVVAARLERQKILDTDRELVLIVTEGALRWCAGSPPVMAAQCAHLASLATSERVFLGIIPWTQPARVAPLHGFHLYDSRAVVVGTDTATAVITDPRDVGDYEKRFTTYQDLAVFGARAAVEFDRIGADYRNLR